jgi:predicted ATPase
LREDGANLSSTLRELKLAKQDNRIVEPLNVIVKALNGYSIEQLGEFLITKLHYTFQNGREQKVSGSLSQESDGTLRLLSILTALYQQREPSLLAIEEPERAIYSTALVAYSDILLKASLSHQVIITTHSPELITYFPNEALRVVEKIDGVTAIGALAQNQKESIEENLLSAGALMRIRGLQRKNKGVMRC